MVKVLVVDDDPAALEIRKWILERAGHEVTTAANAEQARAAVQHDVVILDLRLPGIEDGLALIRAFHGAGARIIVLCGNPADLDHRPEAPMADQILTKPVRSEILLKAIHGS